jgi:hypothetical protein
MVSGVGTVNGSMQPRATASWVIMAMMSSSITQSSIWILQRLERSAGRFSIEDGPKACRLQMFDLIPAGN